MQAQQVLRSRAWISQLHCRMKFLAKFGRNVKRAELLTGTRRQVS